MAPSNNNGSKLDFGFAFNDINFSDRILRIEIEREDEVESTCMHTSLTHWFRGRKSRTKTKNYDELCNIDNGIEVKNIHISSVILAAQSPFFSKLFSNGMKETEERRVTLRIHSSEEVALMDLLNFMYNNKLSSSKTSYLLDVLMVADKFQVSSCMIYCTQLLSNLPMTCESALQFLHLPSTVLMADEVEPLVDAAKHLYKDFTKMEQELLKLPLAGVEIILSSNYIQVNSEDVVYDFVLKWTRKHYPVKEKRQEILTKRLGSLIHFKYMTCEKLKELPSCSDFDPAFASKVLLDALFFKSQSPHLQTNRRCLKQTYKVSAKVLASEFPRPHCVVYLDLKKQELVNLFPSDRLYSEDIHLGGIKLTLFVQRSTKNHRDRPCDCFGLCLLMPQYKSGSCSVGCNFSAISKRTKEFGGGRKCSIILTGGKGWGFLNFFGVSWSQFIAKDSIYFINEVLYLKAEITMNPMNP